MKAINGATATSWTRPSKSAPARRSSGIQFVLSNRPTRVGGRLTDAKGNPTADGTVLLFSVDSARWGDDSRYITTVRPDQQGLFEHIGLPPGEYLAVGAGLRRGRRRERSRGPRETEGGATRFSSTEGAREVVNLVLR